ncbi:uncharacterized protein G2W53_034050 [Senna tora]|uniref:Uncharacterized protein n=1 Tax=Senna tora TaxID=362788 RepID=A0A834TAE7_9FABA|nr:uncharacterized protein G2W53_034050 [Senna tora]
MADRRHRFRLFFCDSFGWFTIEVLVFRILVQDLDFERLPIRLQFGISDRVLKILVDGLPLKARNLDYPSSVAAWSGRDICFHGRGRCSNKWGNIHRLRLGCLIWISLVLSIALSGVVGITGYLFSCLFVVVFQIFVVAHQKSQTLDFPGSFIWSLVPSSARDNWMPLKAQESGLCGGTSEVTSFVVWFWMPLKAWDSGFPQFNSCAWSGRDNCFRGRGGLKSGEIFLCLDSDA